MINYSKLQLAPTASSNKLAFSSTGSFTIPALPGAGETFGQAVIPHGLGTDNLLFQVSTMGGTTNGVFLPWESNDGRLTQYASVDNTNLTITGISEDASGLGAPAYTITYFVRILIP